MSEVTITYCKHCYVNMVHTANMPGAGDWTAYDEGEPFPECPNAERHEPQLTLRAIALAKLLP